MKALVMDSAQPPDPLSRTLASWRVAPSRQPEFRAAVWARLNARPGLQPWAVYARRHAAAVTGALALAVAVGAVGGQSWAKSRVAAESARLAASYVEGLDARMMTGR
jgi:hypothetical protein